MKIIIKFLLIMLITSDIMYCQWEECHGPYGGTITTLMTKGNATYAGTTSRGIFVTFDLGNSWTEMSKGIEQFAVKALVKTNNDIFAGTDYGVFLYDKGRWQERTAGFKNKEISSMTVSGSLIYAGTDSSGVYFSTNNGLSWSQKKNGLIELHINTIVSNADDIFTGTINGLFKIKTSGTSWIKMDQGITNKDIRAVKIMGSFILAGSWGNGIYLSSDYGKTWQNSGLTGLKVTSLESFGEYVFAGTFGNGMFFSTDAGLTWRPINDGIDNLDICSITTDKYYVYAGTYKGTLYIAKLINFGITEVNERNLLTDEVFTIYPNPTYDKVNVIIQSLTNHSEIKIYNHLGQLVNTTLITSFEEIIDIRKFPSGVYFLQIGNQFEMFVKN